jgi:hypothetical protein
MEPTAEQRQWLVDLAASLAEANRRLDAAPPPPGLAPVGTPGRHWRTPQARRIRHVLPGSIVTQYGTTWFRERPRWDAPIVEVAVSMLLGLQSVEYAAMMVTRQSPPKPEATVRCFRTDDLYLAGYFVMHTPTESNPRHVSVFYGEPCGPDEVEKAMACWSDAGRVTLESLAITAGEAGS